MLKNANWLSALAYMKWYVLKVVMEYVIHLPLCDIAKGNAAGDWESNQK